MGGRDEVDIKKILIIMQDTKISVYTHDVRSMELMPEAEAE